MKPAIPRGVLLAICLLPAAAGCAGRKAQVAQTPAARAAAPRTGGVTHRVEAGQTLWRIAKVYGVDLDVLVRANAIADPAALDVGTPLFVPGATELREVPPYPEPLPGQTKAPAASEGRDFVWPLEPHRILSPFGARRSGHRHSGLDIAGRPGEAIAAARDGRVVYTGSTMRGYGKTVVLDHGEGWTTLYAHGSALLVKEGEWVRRGQRIARVGRTGNATTEHCHFELRRNDVPVDPLHYLTGGEGTQ